jgi:RNA polymerase sigma-70 factor (ECF subfamily)
MGVSTATFERSDPQLLSVGYRLTGSIIAALAVAADGSSAADRGELLTRTVRVARAALDASAARRQTYVGQWLPEPIVLEPDSFDDPLASAIAGGGARLATMVALESLPPTTRIAHVLRDGFDTDPAEIAAALAVSEDEVNRLADDGAGQMAGTAQPDSIEDHNEVVAQGVLALTLGDLESLAALVHPDIVYLADSNGTTRTATDPITGSTIVLRLLSTVMSRYGSDMTRYTRPVLVNGEMGLLTDAGIDAQSPLHRRITALAVSGGMITAVYDLSNPDKLTGTPLFR